MLSLPRLKDLGSVSATTSEFSKLASAAKREFTKRK